MAELNGKAAALIVAGAVFAYSGVMGKGVAATARSFITGNDPTRTATQDPVSTDGTAPVFNDVGPMTGTPARNKAAGKLLAASYGWGTGEQWAALDALWTRESGWSNTARNSSSGAYGIPQALPPTKLPAAGQAPLSSGTAQIAWGLSYIKARYGNPVSAWAHELSNGWY